ncbi:MAG TPA: hypothetical protein VG845_12065 [Dehalococcoidia bacterium]|nr:hypothetical protein [Dehalococcoidia bacterium]
MLGEILTWLGVVGATMIAWCLYALGDDAPRNRFHSEDQASEE